MRKFIIAAVAVVLFSLNLRLSVAAIAPVLGQVRDFFGVSTALAGSLTSLPGFMFALMGVCAVPLARRQGLSPVLVWGAVAIVVGTAARPFVGSFWLFFALTVLLVAGIAVGNILLPAWIKEHFSGQQTVSLMTIYTTLLGISGALGPLAAVAFDSWKLALASIAIPGVIMVAVWIPLAMRVGRDQPRAQVGTDNAGSMWKSPTAVAMLFFFGLQSSAAYTQMGWLPHMLTDAGVSPTTAATALALIGASGIVGGLIMPTIIARSSNMMVLPLVLGCCSAAGWAGMWWNSQAAPLLWAGLLGVGGMCFPLALSLLVARTRSPLVTARLSGFVQPGGYVIAGLVPLMVGLAFTAVGSWGPVLCGLVVMALVQAAVGVMATRTTVIDDELRA